MHTIYYIYNFFISKFYLKLIKKIIFSENLAQFQRQKTATKNLKIFRLFKLNIRESISLSFIEFFVASRRTFLRLLLIKYKIKDFNLNFTLF